MWDFSHRPNPSRPIDGASDRGGRDVSGSDVDGSAPLLPGEARGRFRQPADGAAAEDGGGRAAAPSRAAMDHRQAGLPQGRSQHDAGAREPAVEQRPAQGGWASITSLRISISSAGSNGLETM